MSRSPAHLRSAATALRAMAAALSADLDGLVRQGGLSTWRGPAADRHRAASLVQQHRVDAVADELRRVADALDERAATADDEQPEGAR